MRRRLLKVSCAVVAAGLLIVVATLSWWSGTVLGWVGKRWLGVAFSSYARADGGRVVLTDVVVLRPEVRVELSRVEADGPWGWLWAKLSGGRADVVTVGDWRVVVANDGERAEAGAVTEESGGAGWLPLKARLNELMDGLGWLPPVRAGEGVVVFAGREIMVGSARLDGATLRIESPAWSGRRAEEVALTRIGREWTVVAKGAGDVWSARAVSSGARVEAEGSWSGQPWTLSASFGEGGWTPVEAKAVAAGWTVPGERLGWEEAYGEIKGDAHAIWTGGRLVFAAEVAGEPKGDAPPLQISLAGGGDRDVLALERATVRAPGLAATLDEPVRLTTGGKLLSDASRFSVQADLSAWPGSSARGTVTGRVSIGPGQGGDPEVDADLVAKSIEARGWTVNGIEAEARLRWPEVIVSEARVTLPGDERLAVSGRYDLLTRTLADGKVSGRLTAMSYGGWLPAGVNVDEIELTATARGRWPELSHGGEVGFKNLRNARLKPMEGRFVWSGVGETASAAKLSLSTEKASLTAAGSGNRDGVALGELEITGEGATQWRLEAPARVGWSPATRVEGVVLSGAAGRLSVSGDASGVTFSAETVDSGWLRDWLAQEVPAWSIERLTGRGAWSSGTLVMTVGGRARVPLTDDQSATADLDVGMDSDGISLRTLNVSSAGHPVARAEGHLPLVIHPTREQSLEWRPSGRLAFTASTDPAAEFWGRLGELSGLTLETPSLDVAVSGTWRRPEGHAELRVARIAADPGRWPRALPELKNLRADLRGGTDGLFLSALTVELAGQQITAEGGIKAAPDRWPELLREPARLAREGGSLRVRIPDAEVAALARFLPEVLAPTGRLRLDLALRETGGWDGVLNLAGAASRPLGPLGVLGDINADIRLRDRALLLEHVGARVGGQPVVLSGSVDLTDWRRPSPALTLKGTNLPLVRRSGVLVRSDLDLRADTDAATGRVKVAGAVTLHDSLLLADLRSLLPGGAARGAARRPPYFAVEVPPLDAWGLDVAVQGERFLRVRTPLFNGVVSSRFRLGGTLGEPTLSGEAPINAGVIRLPFANFTLEQGEVRIGAPDPTEPRLRLSATGRSYGYDLRLDLSGTASAPELAFSSTPPLTSEQVLLMVMAGETPSNEINYTAGRRAVRVGAYLGQSLLDTFGLRGEGADRLTVNVGERVSEQGRETYDVSYELSKDWSLVGGYTEFDEYNMGVQWRVYTSKPKVEKEEGADAK